MKRMNRRVSASFIPSILSKFLSPILLLGLAACGGNAAPTAQTAAAKLTYPESKRVDQVDDYHGEKVADPYRWLEQLDSPETKAWIEAQNKVTFAYLEKIPQRAAYKERLTQLWNYERFGMPVKGGARYFYTRNDGLQNQSVLYVADSLDGAPRVLLDPATLLADGTAALAAWIPSEDGKLIAYGIQEAGSDWEQWKVRDVTTGNDLSEQLKGVKWAAVAWAKDGSGLYYSRYDGGVNFFSKLFFHKLGTPQSEDRLIYENRDIKEWTFIPEVSQDGRYLIIFIWKGSDGTNQIYYKDLQKPDAPVVELIKGFDAAYSFVGNDRGRFWIRTEAGAPLGRVVEVDTAQPERSKWKTVIPEAGEALQDVSLVGDRFFASYLKDASSQIRVFDLKGAPVREVALPGLGSAGGFNGQRADTETFYAFLSFIEPPTIYRYDVRSGASTVFKQPQLKFNAADFETRRVFVTSKDGTKVPMFVTHRRGMKLDGNNPTIMYGYGAFRISLTPRFSPETVAFLEQGGVYAQPSLRGGFEYGEAWHQGGMFDRKQNVFDDFIASAEWLIANKYTQPSKLAIRGGSNGGLLVGAVMTQRPELFGAALPAVGVMDMLRFQHFSINWTLAAEYGSSDKPDQFRYLRAYSPLHNLKPGTKYPPTLITAGDHDDRLPPIHSYKFAATIQHDQAGDAPVLIRIDTRTGHGMGRPIAKEIDLAADSLAFIHQSLGMN
ncbi:MAG TPA: prolyl oligopeptidase family serine peptidase [Steroidobacteraceae bacterium]|nr:prolyl oligopeptidase family serine peptidase [Steroidobacteraceae bacterium]